MVIFWIISYLLVGFMCAVVHEVCWIRNSDEKDHWDSVGSLWIWFWPAGLLFYAVMGVGDGLHKAVEASANLYCKFRDKQGS